MAHRAAFLAASLTFAALANAQVGAYGQCGGESYTGSTSCTSGYFCTSYNPYYYQCIPGTATGTTTSTSSSSHATTTTTTTTSSSTTSKSTTVSSTKTTTSSAPASTGTKYFITFGDSYSQTGFVDTETWATAGNILGNPTFPGWTTSGGNNWIDYLISDYNNSLMLSFNLAYGGATTSASLVAPYESTVLCFDNQTAEFESTIASHPSNFSWAAADTLVGVWIGVNDVGNIYYEATATVDTLLSEIMTEYFGLLQQIYNAGARNFALLNVPPINKSPLMLAESTADQDLEATVITQYNDLLVSNLASFVESNSGSTGVVVDTQAPFNTVINDPTAYGAANATCYDDDGTTCVWWNNYHPAMAIHKLVAEAVAAAFSGTFFT